MNATKKKKSVIEYLVQNVALVMLADTASEPHIRKAAEKHRIQLFLSLPKEEHEPIFLMRDIMLKLATKLAGCQSIDELVATEHLIQELVAGRVLIVDDATGDYLHAQMKAQDGTNSGK